MKKNIYVLSLVLIFGFTKLMAQEATEPISNPNKWELNIGLSPTSTILKSDLFDNNTNTRAGFGFNVDFAYPLYQKSKYKLSASLGVGFNKYTSEIVLDYGDSLWTNDKDESFYLVEKADNLMETRTISFLNIPFWLRNSYVFNDDFEVYANLGMFYAPVLTSNYTSQATVTRTGYYPSTHATLYDIDVTSSPYFFPTNKELYTGTSNNINRNYGYMFAFGAKYQIEKNISIFVDYSFSNGLANLNKNSKNDHIVLVQENGAINSLMKKGDKVQTKAYGIQFGVSFKLKCRK